MKLIFVIGATNAGKSTLIEAARAAGHGAVEVGKEMRKRHPPEYFDGKAAMLKTELEVWAILDEQLNTAQSQGKSHCFIDGMPRLMNQFHTVCDRFDMDNVLFLHLWCPVEIRERRARARDEHDPAKLALSLSRLRGDATELYEITAAIVWDRYMYVIHNTAVSDWSAAECVTKIVRRFYAGACGGTKWGAR